MAQNDMHILTAPIIGKALREGTPCRLRDGGNLVLIVTGKNQGKWLFKGRKKGSRTEIDLVCGYAPETGLREARAKREEFRAQLKQGINPNQIKRQKKEEAQRKEREGKTFREVSGEYLDNRQDIVSKTLQGEAGRLYNHCASILDLPVAGIRRGEHLKPLLDGLLQANSYEQAKRVAGLVGRVFRFAVDCGYIELSPAERLYSLLPRRSPGEQNHHAAQTTSAGAGALFGKVWSYAHSHRSVPAIACALQMLCYVPIRCSNLLEARWEDVDLDGATWHFPKTKNGRAYDLPIPRQVKNLFAVLLEHYEGAGFCFPNSRRTGHISDGGIRQALRSAGIGKEEQSIHGFRSTFQSVAVGYGLPKTLTERALFHVAGGPVEQAYNRALLEEPTRALMQWWADCVDALRDGKKEVPAIPDDLLKGGAFQ